MEQPGLNRTDLENGHAPGFGSTRCRPSSVSGAQSDDGDPLRRGVEGHGQCAELTVNATIRQEALPPAVDRQSPAVTRFGDQGDDARLVLIEERRPAIQAVETLPESLPAG